MNFTSIPSSSTNVFLLFLGLGIASFCGGRLVRPWNEHYAWHLDLQQTIAPVRAKFHAQIERTRLLRAQLNNPSGSNAEIARIYETMMWDNIERLKFLNLTWENARERRESAIAEVERNLFVNWLGLTLGGFLGYFGFRNWRKDEAERKGSSIQRSSSSKRKQKRPLHQAGV